MNNTFFQLIQNKNLFLVTPRKINFSDILLRPSGTSSYSSEISEAFVTVWSSYQGIWYILHERIFKFKFQGPFQYLFRCDSRNFSRALRPGSNPINSPPSLPGRVTCCQTTVNFSLSHAPPPPCSHKFKFNKHVRKYRVRCTAGTVYRRHCQKIQCWE